MDIYESYDVLELKPGATEAEIKAQYRKLLHEWHPDRNRASKQKEAEATEKTALLNNAYDVIRSHIIPYTIPKPEAGTTSTHAGSNGHRQANTGAAYGVKREPSRSASWQTAGDVSRTRKSYVKRISVDGEIGTGLKVALGITLLLFVATVFYGLTGGRGLSLADLLMNRGSESASQATNNNSGAPSASAGTNSGNGSVYVNNDPNDPNSSDPYASSAPSLDNQSGYQGSAGQANTIDPYASQAGSYGSGSSGQNTNQGSSGTQSYSGTQGYSSAGTANGQNTVNQNNGQGATNSGEGSNAGMSNYYGNYNNYAQGSNGYGEGYGREGGRGGDDDDD